MAIVKTSTCIYIKILKKYVYEINVCAQLNFIQLYTYGSIQFVFMRIAWSRDL